MSEHDPARAPQPGRDLFGRRITERPAGRQLPLPLGWAASAHGTDPVFLTGDSNAEAVLHIQRFADWPSPASVLVGPPGSGRSTLARLFAEASGGEVIDPFAGSEEIAVFHAWNRAQAERLPLLLVADDEAELVAVRLPDLATRLATAPVVRFGAPDLALSAALIDRLLLARGVHLATPVGGYVAARIDRSYAAIHAAVAAIDAHSFAGSKAAGLRNVRAALIAAGLYGETTPAPDSPEKT